MKTLLKTVLSVLCVTATAFADMGSGTGSFGTIGPASGSTTNLPVGGGGIGNNFTNVDLWTSGNTRGSIQVTNDQLNGSSTAGVVLSFLFGAQTNAAGITWGLSGLHDLGYIFLDPTHGGTPASAANSELEFISGGTIALIPGTATASHIQVGGTGIGPIHMYMQNAISLGADVVGYSYPFGFSTAWNSNNITTYTHKPGFIGRWGGANQQWRLQKIVDIPNDDLWTTNAIVVWDESTAGTNGAGHFLLMHQWNAPEVGASTNTVTLTATNFTVGVSNSGANFVVTPTGLVGGAYNNNNGGFTVDGATRNINNNSGNLTFQGSSSGNKTTFTSSDGNTRWFDIIPGGSTSTPSTNFANIQVATNGIASYSTNYTIAAGSSSGYTNTTGKIQAINIQGTSGSFVYYKRAGAGGATVASVPIWTNTIIASGDNFNLGVNCGVNLVSPVGVTLVVDDL